MLMLAFTVAHSKITLLYNLCGLTEEDSEKYLSLSKAECLSGSSVFLLAFSTGTI